MTDTTITVTGIVETVRDFNAIANGIIPALMITLNREHEIIMTLAKERTPVDTGALRASGHVVPPVVLARTIKSMGAFGGPSASYALKVHEDLNVYHHVGRVKYYESAVQDQRGHVRGAVEATVNQLISSQ